jgi:hypothetical protein
METATEAVRHLIVEVELLLSRARRLAELIDTIPTDPAKAELLGVSEIAKIFGVHPATVSRWVQRGRLPEPLAQLASGDVWNLAQIESVKLQRDGFPAWPDEPEPVQA